MLCFQHHKGQQIQIQSRYGLKDNKKQTLNILKDWKKIMPGTYVKYGSHAYETTLIPKKAGSLCKTQMKTECDHLQICFDRMYNQLNSRKTNYLMLKLINFIVFHEYTLILYLRRSGWHLLSCHRDL